MNRNVVFAVIIIVGIIALGLVVNNSIKKNNFMSGTLSQSATPTPVTVTVTQSVVPGRPKTTIKTNKGDIVIEMRPDLAPKTVANFLDKFTNGFCEGLTFHRVEDWVVQGCDPLGNGTGGNTSLPTETSAQPFVIGGVGVARKSTPRELSNDSQFFIVKKESTFLNNDYTYFGQVIEGMDIVNKLQIGDKIIKTINLTK